MDRLERQQIIANTFKDETQPYVKPDIVNVLEKRKQTNYVGYVIGLLIVCIILAIMDHYGLIQPA